MKSHYTIPIFIPEKACPFRCVYCNQYRITNADFSPQAADIKEVIDSYLKTIPKEGYKRIAFFGGSFTGMSIDEQNQYLEVAKTYLEKGDVVEIQLSTRPDYITQEILDNLKHYGVRIIELGAQSLDDEVLIQTGRGHTVDDIRNASNLIRSNGFDLGLQMMIGLPSDTYEKTMKTAMKIIDLGAKYTRIYPTLVIKDTYLETLYQRGKYLPLSLEDAVIWSNDLLKLFDNHNIVVLRLGLHPSEGLLTGESLVAGPFHVSFKELVFTARWKEIFKQLEQQKGKNVVIKVRSEQYNTAIGYGKSNRNFLLTIFEKVNFGKDDSLNKWEFEYCIQ